MKEAHPLEQSLGMELYSTESKGIGGKLKERFEDFVVQEITPDKTTLQIGDWSVTDQSHSIEGERSRFLTFAVQKMGLATMDVATILAAFLKVSRNYVTYAGLKDKRAITVQTMSVPAKAAESLPSIELSRIVVRDIRYTRQPIQIGDLWGNRFTILLKDIDEERDVALETAEQLKNTPLLNYFGVQRFGITRPYTHLVGKALVQRDFEKAVRIMLSTTSEYESEELTDIRKQLSEDMTPTEKFIEAFPKELSYEKDVMKYLMKSPGEYEKAIMRIPPRVLTLQVHAFQSYIFNKIISERARLGIPIDRPQVGDFLIKLDETHSGRDSWVFVTESTLLEREQQVASGEYGLTTPVPGYSTRLPPSKQTDLVKQALKNEDVELREFRNSRVKALDAPGGLHLTSIVMTDLESFHSNEGLQVKFSLRKGSYATMVMREIMKNHPINRV
ncbi:MAG: tRNA pseudouridine(13) synthase TruD [Candidatus Thorarchaeota archaeon]|jgi:tRNA pseudouridine13 synthase